MADVVIPEGLSADYVNEQVERAIRELNEHPDWERLATLLNTLGEGYLVVDVTATQKKKATHIRTLRSTTGQLVLPLFTSMHELRDAVPKNKREHVRGAIMPALDALQLIHSDRFVAAQVNPGGAALVIKREFVERALSAEPLDASTEF
jgi:methyl coenzyme M reductase beta subunit